MGVLKLSILDLINHSHLGEVGSRAYHAVRYLDSLKQVLVTPVLCVQIVTASYLIEREEVQKLVYGDQGWVGDVLDAKLLLHVS